MTIQTRTFTDPRDESVYRCVLMADGKWWSADSLRWNGSGVHVNSDPSTIEEYGKLYRQSESFSAVPNNTHVPSETEIRNLCGLLGILHASSDPSSIAAVSSVKDTSYWGVPGTNSTGYSSRAAGARTELGQFYHFGTNALFMSSTGEPTSYTLFRWTLGNDNLAYLIGGGGNDWLSVRFIVDEFPATSSPKYFFPSRRIEMFPSTPPKVVTRLPTLHGRTVL